MTARVRIGSRGSDLALWQARFVGARLGADVEIVVIKTQGDEIQHLSLDKVEGKGFFTKEIEMALLSGEIDLAVHSYKDLPTEGPQGLLIAAVPQRGPARDVLVTRTPITSTSAGRAVRELRPGATVGTSSLRRKAQLLALGSAITLADLRGNVPTRVRRVEEGALDAVVLAEAGISRLELGPALAARGVHIVPFTVGELCPAPAQGALAVQVRADDAATRALAAVLHHAPTALAVETERGLLRRFGGGCQLPLGVFAECTSRGVRLTALVAAPDGGTTIAATVEGDPEFAIQAAYADLVNRGAARYL